MNRVLAKRVVVLCSTMLLLTSVFSTGVSYADKADGSTKKETTLKTSKDEDNAKKTGDKKKKRTKAKASARKASSSTIENKVILSFDRVKRPAYKNKSGVFTVVFRGAWGNEGTYREMVDDGWTFAYKLTEGSKTIASGSGFDPKKKVKIKDGGDSYILTVTASKSGEKSTYKSNTVGSFKFPAVPKGVKASTKKSTNDAKLVWKKVKGASYYYVYRSTKKKAPSKPMKKVKRTSFKDGNLSGKKYYYWVQAIMKNKKYTTASLLSKVDGIKIKEFLTDKVRPYHWYAKAKKSTKLYKRRSGGASKGKLKKGTRVRLTLTSPKRLKYGQRPKRVLAIYKKNGKVKKGWVKYTGVFKSVKAQVSYKKSRAYDWTRDVKEKWVNKKKYKSRTKYLIWVSTYTQRVNIFKKKGGKWRLIKHFRTTTGSYLYPTRSGNAYKIFRHKPRRVRQFTHSSKHYYYTHLSYFRGGDAFHTISWILEDRAHRVVKSVKKNLKPDTRGCCRLKVPDAKWIYSRIPTKTRVVVY